MMKIELGKKYDFFLMNRSKYTGVVKNISNDGVVTIIDKFGEEVEFNMNFIAVRTEIKEARN